MSKTIGTLESCKLGAYHGSYGQAVATALQDELDAFTTNRELSSVNVLRAANRYYGFDAADNYRS